MNKTAGKSSIDVGLIDCFFIFFVDFFSARLSAAFSPKRHFKAPTGQWIKGHVGCLVDEFDPERLYAHKREMQAE